MPPESPISEYLLKAIATAGGIGSIYCAGLIYFIGRRLLWVCEAIDRQTKKDCYMLVASSDVHPNVKEAVTTLIKETEAAEQKRS
jgi:hypothetical protein